ncbi:pantoate--beta-alanine ligase [Helicobacter anatolicus]|uniref:pantoate--beta-alanine ligase n=1 Tax=Helicobacter anatolicus TaxID=2905874 RepID=UPI001E63E88A|nr:pantoate--beta-alanine ligase [Helicobacter anatolicus]MCE3038593.1 pantoate--beta-alanine ligase [Helicobacter anatolicus]
MQILKNVEELISYRRSLPSNSNVGLVPTMGALHKGHQSLIQRSVANNSHTILSIFVNPTQFGPTEDFEKYPRTLQKDCEIAKSCGVSAVFAPEITEMYPNNDEITLHPPKNMGYIFEGFIRDGHFDGVLQIVLKLFHLIQPHFAYFGQKDAQQLLIIKRLVKDTFLPLKIIPCPTIRDTDGLALSSRNIYLSATQRQHALEIPQSLQYIKELINNGTEDTKTLIKSAKQILKNITLDYLAITDYNLQEISTIQPNNSLVLIAAKVGNTRLIDNLWL